MTIPEHPGMCDYEWTGEPALILTDIAGNRTGETREHGCAGFADHLGRGEPHECRCGATTTRKDER